MLRNALCPPGAFVLAISLTLAGLLLSTDYLVLRRRILVGLGAVCRDAARKPAGARHSPNDLRSKKVKLKSDDIDPPTDADAEEEGELPEPWSRIRGKRVDEAGEEKRSRRYRRERIRARWTTKNLTATTPRKPKAATTRKMPKRRPNPKARNLASVPAWPVRSHPQSGWRKDRDSVIEQLEAASRAEEPVQYELPPIDLLLPNEIVAPKPTSKKSARKPRFWKRRSPFGFKVKVVEIETGRSSRNTKSTGSWPAACEDHQPGRRSGDCPARAERSHRRADSGQEHRRHRSAEQRAATGPPARGDRGADGKGEDAHPDLLGQRRVGQSAGGRSFHAAAPAIAGRTGTGKSVCLNSIIVSMLMSRGPDDVRMLMIDPKMVELSPYKTAAALMHPVVTDMRKAEAILAWAVEKMEERYALLARAGVRHIGVYNQLGEEELIDRLQPETDEERAQIPLHLPYIVIVADEIADLMMTSGKEVEQHIIRLAQKSRAIGIHLVLATQKPTVDVITGLIKSNLPARIAFQVASRTDSRVVLDEMGADKLLGNGDMLFLWPGTSTLLRGQGTYLSDDEINKVVDFVATTEPQFVKELVQLKAADHGEGKAEKLKSRDEHYEEAVEIVIREGRGSVSLLQRALGIGYGRAARLIDFMAEDGIVGTYNGSQAREVLITLDQWSQMIGEQSPPEPPRRSATASCRKPAMMRRLTTTN